MANDREHSDESPRSTTFRILRTEDRSRKPVFIRRSPQNSRRYFVRSSTNARRQASARERSGKSRPQSFRERYAEPSESDGESGSFLGLAEQTNPLESYYATKFERPSRYDDDDEPEVRFTEQFNKLGMSYNRMDHDSDDDDLYLSEYSSRHPLSENSWWLRAARPPNSNKTSGSLIVSLQFVVLRRGQRISRTSRYTKGQLTDSQFGRILKKEYRALKTELSLVQKVISYKTVAFVWFLQWRCKKRGFSWVATDRKPILDLDRPHAEDHFRYRLKYPIARERTWTTTLDKLIIKGAVIDVEIKETFDVVKVFWGLFAAVLLSLGVGLGYGFGMDHDFSTGFAISSWLLTAFAFFFAVIAAGEWFGLSKFADNHSIDADIDLGYERTRSKRPEVV